jgi:hypothetical protein
VAIDALPTAGSGSGLSAREREARQLRYDPPRSTEELTDAYGRRCARVLTEAYAQDGLISYGELQWIFLACAETISRGIDASSALTK